LLLGRSLHEGVLAIEGSATSVGWCGTRGRGWMGGRGGRLVGGELAAPRGPTAPPPAHHAPPAASLAP